MITGSLPEQAMEVMLLENFSDDQLQANQNNNPTIKNNSPCRIAWIGAVLQQVFWSDNHYSK